MKSRCAVLLGIACLPLYAVADTGEEIFKARCSLCHEGGAGGAPRIGDRAEWEPRAAWGKLALYEVALKGKPNTAMMARGGFRDLSNDDVMSAVDYMVARAGLKPGLKPEPPPPAELGGAAVAAALPGNAQPARLAADADDKTVTAHIAEALRAELAPPGSRVETTEQDARVGGLGIKVTTREGVVSLQGMVKDAEIIERAEANRPGRERRQENRQQAHLGAAIRMGLKSYSAGAALLFGLLAGFVANEPLAQGDYPSRAIRMVVDTSPGCPRCRPPRRRACPRGR